MDGKQDETWCGSELLRSPLGGVVLWEVLRGQICPPIWSAPVSEGSWKGSVLLSEIELVGKV